jgi:hypothetical protein
VVYLDQTTVDNHDTLPASEGILQTVTKDENERQALAQLVGTGRRTRSPDTPKLIKHPVLGSI